jgi:hypothetical protein
VLVIQHHKTSGTDSSPLRSDGVTGQMSKKRTPVVGSVTEPSDLEAVVPYYKP